MISFKCTKERNINMYDRTNVSFQEALEIIETLPEQQREDLINIIKHRIIEHRREQLARNIREAKKEYSRGEIKKGTVDDLMREITE